MSKYDNDRRVRPGRHGGYIVTADSGDVYQVLPTKVFAWCIFAGTDYNPQMAQDAEGNLAFGYSDADAAIRAVLGGR